MSVRLNKLKNLLIAKTSGSDDDSRADPKPQVGFRVSYCQTAQRMKVKVIGARHLPTIYGTMRPLGYLVKVGILLSADIKLFCIDLIHFTLCGSEINHLDVILQLNKSELAR